MHGADSSFPQMVINEDSSYSVFRNVQKHWITEDETWQLFQPILTKQENKAWLSPDDAKCRVVSPKLTNKKTMIILAFTADTKFSVEVSKPKETVTGERYIDFIRNTGEKWRRLHSTPTKLSEVWWQHDNARPYKASLTKRFLFLPVVKLLWWSSRRTARISTSVMPGFLQL